MPEKAHYTDALLEKQAIFSFCLKGLLEPVTIAMSRDLQQPVQAIHITMGQVILSDISWRHGKIRACVQSATRLQTAQFEVLSCREVV